MRVINLSVSLIIFLSMAILNDLEAFYPWGKDACMARREKSTCCEKNVSCPTPLLGGFAEVLIEFHQEVISPADGPRSHFMPSSSQYTLDAMRKYGFFKGYAMGCDRLMRENEEPWVYKTIVLEDGTVKKLDPVR